MKIIISGGGTGGHIFPAIAIADEIKRQRPDADILFVGAEGKMEMERVPKAGYKIEGLPVVGFQRKLTTKNLLFPLKLAKSLFKAIQIIRKFKPDVVVGVGGYASGPILEMGMRLGVKGVIQEQNSYAGVTNKILGRKVQKVCVAYEGMEAFFPKEKIVLTGNPVRADISAETISAEHAKIDLGFDPNKKLILLIGGSLGAKTLNEAMRAATDILKNRNDVQLYWQCGKAYIDEFSTSETAALPNVKISAFVDDMKMAYTAADIVISRAGALSISELCLVAKPCIFVPSPNVSEDHQTKNAMALVNKKAAILVKDIDAKEQLLTKTLEILDNEMLSITLSLNIEKLGKPYAAKEIVAEILSF
jgi:UDP-N-acetylglucosamine--N-acetylmuramyl-(pentapeptide) pyrophosphoryl-undecaprenol N-acetylglucosamine transferase